MFKEIRISRKYFTVEVIELGSEHMDCYSNYAEGFSSLEDAKNAAKLVLIALQHTAEICYV